MRFISRRLADKDIDIREGTYISHITFAFSYRWERIADIDTEPIGAWEPLTRHLVRGVSSVKSRQHTLCVSWNLPFLFRSNASARQAPFAQQLAKPSTRRKTFDRLDYFRSGRDS